MEVLVERGGTVEDLVTAGLHGEFVDGFDGSWLSLPDGQNLCTYVVESDDDWVLYTSPILRNGDRTYLRIRQYLDDGSIEVEGTWDASGPGGAVDRGAEPLVRGDVIVPLYDAFSADEAREESTYAGEEYEVGRRLEVDYGLLFAGTYQYAFRIEDAYGDCMTTDPVELEVDEKGSTYFFE